MNSKDLQEAVITILAAGLVPNITGSPGIGKSDIIRGIAKQFRLKVIDLRLSQCDPTDLNNNQVFA
jgi:MoxR-like ATPase